MSGMATQDDHSPTFDSLVSGISAEERKTLLNKMQSGATSENASLETQENFSDEESSIDFRTRLNQESVLLRFWLWIKSLFSSNSIEEEYNKSLVAGIAHSIERQSSGLLDYHHQYLSSVFYEKLLELKHTADFFSGYIAAYEANPSSFYILLGSLIMPEISDEMDKQADPYSYSLNKEINSEMRTSLLRKMDDVLQGIAPDKKAEMYACVRSIEWLRQFTKLPFEGLLAKFTAVINDMKICAFDQVENEMASMARILCSGKTIPDEVLEALYLYSMHQTAVVDFDDIDQKSTGQAFMDTAAAQLSVISMFISTVPMRSVSCVVYNNALFVPEGFGGGEDWYVKYKAEWKKLFDRKWESWLRDCKKEKLKAKLMEYFEIAVFPAYPRRPWAELWGGVPFRYEMTLGFLNHFMKTEFTQYSKTLKVITLEGDFAIKENRLEFNDTTNEFANIDDSLDDLFMKLGNTGEYGAEFARYEETNKRTTAASQKIKSVMDDIEDAVASLINLFGEAARIMQKLLTGLLSTKVDSHYGNLTNIASIQGRDNKHFKEDLEKCKLGIDHAFEMLKELEPLDMPIGDK